MNCPEISCWDPCGTATYCWAARKWLAQYHYQGPRINLQPYKHKGVGISRHLRHSVRLELRTWLPACADHVTQLGSLYRQRMICYDTFYSMTPMINRSINYFHFALRTLGILCFERLWLAHLIFATRPVWLKVHYVGFNQLNHAFSSTCSRVCDGCQVPVA